MASRPDESLYFSTVIPPRLAIFNDADTCEYLKRINLPVDTLDQPPSLELLEQVHLAHHLGVPYDTSSLHVPENDWKSPSKPIQLGKGSGMSLGTPLNFDRIVRRHRGGFCYANNTLYAALLKSLGFRVSEVGTRVYLHRGKDPKVAGWWWSSITHELCIVDWPGSDGRFMVDAGFGGGGCPRPISLVDGATSSSLSPTESFYLAAENLPAAGIPTIYDPAPGFTLYRRVCPPGATVADSNSVALAEGEFWTPCIHFTLQTISPDDIKMSTWYNETHPEAPFVNFFVVSLLLPSGARRTLSYGPPPIDMQNGNEAEAAATKMAKLYTKEGISGVEQDVQWIPFETDAVRKVLEREFDFVF